MKFGDMIKTLRTIQYERIEVRDAEGNEVFTCPASSEFLLITYENFDVIEWFPHGAPKKTATLTVYLEGGDDQ